MSVEQHIKILARDFGITKISVIHVNSNNISIIFGLQQNPTTEFLKAKVEI